MEELRAEYQEYIDQFKDLSDEQLLEVMGADADPLNAVRFLDETQIVAIDTRLQAIQSQIELVSVKFSNNPFLRFFRRKETAEELARLQRERDALLNTRMTYEDMKARLIKAGRDRFEFVKGVICANQETFKAIFDSGNLALLVTTLMGASATIAGIPILAVIAIGTLALRLNIIKLCGS